MNTCPKCGKYIPDGGRMCIACGWKPEENIEDITAPILKYMQDAFNEMSEGFEGKTEKSDEYHERKMAAVGYIGPAFLYTLYKYKDSQLVRYHANQACIMFMANIAADMVGKVPFIGGTVKRVLKTALALLAFSGARNAYQNKMEPVPYLGELDISVIK